MRALPALAIAILVAGCVGEPPAPADVLVEDAPKAVSSRDISFSGQDWPFLCPPAGGVCVVSGMPTGAEQFPQDLASGEDPLAFSLDVAWSGTEDPVEFVVEVVCAADEEGDDGCRSDVVLADAQGPLPLHLEAANLDLPAGAIIVYRVAWQSPIPGVIGGTGQTFEGTGTIDVRGPAA